MIHHSAALKHLDMVRRDQAQRTANCRALLRVRSLFKLAHSLLKGGVPHSEGGGISK